jgi:peptidyl-prolyl cis-trans isomerase SurA
MLLHTLARSLARLTRPAGALALVAGLALTGAALAQSPFSPAFWVNDHPVTQYQLEQRARFLDVLGSGGDDSLATARQRLIEDRLRVTEARRFGLRATREQVEAGMAEFAARAQLSTAEFLENLGRAGVSRATFEDFVHAGIVWRELAQAMFGARVQVSEADIDAAMSVANRRGVQRIQLSEIFLPSDPQFAQAVAELIPRILAIDSFEEFANAARQVSAAPSRERGGRVDEWLELGNLPPNIAVPFATAAPGTIIGPIEIPGAFAIFQLRARSSARDLPAGQIELDYMRAALPGGRSEANLALAEAIVGRVDMCSALPTTIGRLAPDLPADTVQRVTQRQSALAQGAAVELGRLDVNELSYNTVEAGALVIYMLCARRFIPDPERSRDEVRQQVFVQQLGGMAEIYLQNLIAESEIRDR